MTKPLISVIIPVFNAERYLEAAIASVLGQSYPTLDLIVVDDGSSDGSMDVASRISDKRCRILRQTNSGAAAARNLGVTESSGTLLAFLDADDLWMRDKLRVQLRALADRPALDMVFGHYEPFRDQGERQVVPEHRPGYSLGTMLIRRDSFMKVGLLATEWRVGEFIDWYARAQEAGLEHAMLDQVVMRRRIHDSNLTGRDRESQVDYTRILRAAAARRART